MLFGLLFQFLLLAGDLKLKLLKFWGYLFVQGRSNGFKHDLRRLLVLMAFDHLELMASKPFP